MCLRITTIKVSAGRMRESFRHRGCPLKLCISLGMHNSADCSHGVQAINLENNQLTGTIPAAWSRLSRLKSLQLAYNNLRYCACMVTACLPCLLPCVPSIPNWSVYAVCSSCISDGFDKLASLMVVSLQQSGLSHDGTGCPDSLLPAWAEFSR